MAAYTSTALGAPRSGRFAVGDTVTDGANIVWRCVRATSPRQWIPVNDPLGSGGTVAVKTGLSVVEMGDSIMRKSVVTLAPDTSFTVTDTLAYLGTKIYTFPEGYIHLFSAHASLDFAVPGTRTTGINDNASLTFGVGTATASNIVLATTMVDLVAKQTKALGTGADYQGVTTAINTTAAMLDGHTTPVDAFLNFGFETNTQIDGDAVLYAKGTVTFLWTLLGDA